MVRKIGSQMQRMQHRKHDDQNQPAAVAPTPGLVSQWPLLPGNPD
jgi:hypothetical protein